MEHQKGSLEERIKEAVESQPVMLFMKGTPVAPRCGFSSKVVNALKDLDVKFGHFDILGDEEIRQVGSKAGSGLNLAFP